MYYSPRRRNRDRVDHDGDVRRFIHCFNIAGGSGGAGVHLGFVGPGRNRLVGGNLRRFGAVDRDRIPIIGVEDAPRAREGRHLLFERHPRACGGRCRVHRPLYNCAMGRSEGRNVEIPGDRRQIGLVGTGIGSIRKALQAGDRRDRMCNGKVAAQWNDDVGAPPRHCTISERRDLRCRIFHLVCSFRRLDDLDQRDRRFENDANDLVGTADIIAEVDSP